MIVAVKLPNKFNERVLSFPFLHALNDYLKQVAAEDPEDDTYQIHLISVKENIDALNLLPFEAYYHELEEEDLKSVFTAHRACANFTFTFPFDAYISTTTSFVDASIGKNLGAKNKIGFDLGKNKWLLNKKVTHPGKVHKSEEIFPLIKSLSGTAPNIPNVYARTVQPLYLDWSENPYLVIDLDLKGEEISDEWKELIELSVNKRFVFMCSSLNEFMQKDKVQDFISELPSKNTYKYFHYDSNIELAKLITYSMGFVTPNSGLMCLATYSEVSTFYMNKGDNLDLVGPKYFRGELKSYDYQSAETFSYNLIFDDLVALIDSKTQAEE